MAQPPSPRWVTAAQVETFATASFTNDQILSNPTTNYVILPQVSGAQIFAITAIIKVVLVADYTNIGDRAWMGIDNLSGAFNDPIDSLAAFNYLFTTPATKYFRLDTPGGRYSPDQGLIMGEVVAQDLPIRLRMFNADGTDFTDLGNLTGGDPGNSMTITVSYALMEL